jgi:hypothetical protein
VSTSPLISLTIVAAVCEPGPMRALKFRQGDVMASPPALREQLSPLLAEPVKS